MIANKNEIFLGSEAILQMNDDNLQLLVYQCATLHSI